MGFDALVARLERDAEARIRRIREAGEAAARELRAAAQAERARRLDEALAQRRATRAVALEREFAARRAELRAELLRAQHDLVAAVFARAEGLAEAALAAPRHRDALARHLEEALRYLGDRPGRVRCAPPLGPRVRALLAGRAALELTLDARCPAGVQVAARDGSLTIDNTLAARLRRVRPGLEAALLEQASR